jgi:myosin heavy subunit
VAKSTKAQTALGAAQEQVIQLQADLKAERAKTAALSENNAKLAADVALLEVNNKTLNVDLRSLAETNRMLAEKVKAYNTQDAMNTSVELRSFRAMAETQATDSQNLLEMERARALKLAGENASLQQERANLKSWLATLQDRELQLKKSLVSMDTKLDKATRELEEKAEKYVETLAKAQRLLDENDEMNQQCKAMKTTCDQLSAKADRAKSLETELRSLQAANDQMGKDLAEAKAARDKGQAVARWSMMAHLTEKQALQTRNTELVREVAEVHSVLDSKRKQCDAADQAIVKLTSEITLLKVELDNKIREMGDLRVELERSEMKAEESVNMMNAMRLQRCESVQSGGSSPAAQPSSHDVLRRSNKQYQRQIDMLQSQIATMKEDHASEIAQLTRERSMSTSELSAAYASRVKELERAHEESERIISKKNRELGQKTRSFLRQQSSMLAEAITPHTPASSRQIARWQELMQRVKHEQVQARDKKLEEQEAMLTELYEAMAAMALQGPVANEVDAELQRVKLRNLTLESELATAIAELKVKGDSSAVAVGGSSTRAQNEPIGSSLAEPTETFVKRERLELVKGKLREALNELDHRRDTIKALEASGAEARRELDKKAETINQLELELAKKTKAVANISKSLLLARF